MSGTADLPLHGGSAPAWLFQRMEDLGGAISELIVREYGRDEYLERLSDPYWFQAFGCVLGFDWHSSGLTTTTMGALKEALDLGELGVAVAGGKGKNAWRTTEELEESVTGTSDLERLKEASRTSASVDGSCVQDGHELYHHTLIFSEDGEWTVVQQGMSDEYARRYHWSSLDDPGFLDDPQSGIAAMERRGEVLDLSSRGSRETRQVSLDLVRDDPVHLERYVKKQSTLEDFTGKELKMPDHHRLKLEDLSTRSIRQLERAYEEDPEDYEELLKTDGVGKKSLRALALIAELVHGSESSWEDPAKYSYAHGGKDGTPYPVDRERYDRSIEELENAVREKVDGKEERKALERLGDLRS